MQARMLQSNESLRGMLSRMSATIFIKIELDRKSPIDWTFEKYDASYSTNLILILILLVFVILLTIQRIEIEIEIETESERETE